MTGRRSILLASTIVLAGLLGPAGAAFAQDLTVVWADDSNSDVTYDPRVTQSRHEEQVIVPVHKNTGSEVMEATGTSCPKFFGSTQGT